jgi:hypothetical protein
VVVVVVVIIIIIIIVRRKGDVGEKYKIGLLYLVFCYVVF